MNGNIPALLSYPRELWKLNSINIIFNRVLCCFIFKSTVFLQLSAFRPCICYLALFVVKKENSDLVNFEHCEWIIFYWEIRRVWNVMHIFFFLVIFVWIRKWSWLSSLTKAYVFKCFWLFQVQSARRSKLCLVLQFVSHVRRVRFLPLESRLLTPSACQVASGHNPTFQSAKR